MNKTKIEWCDYTWNPVVGCKHGCKYCYARRMNQRFRWIPKWTEPQFFLKRLFEPNLVKKPSKIFVGSVCDLFGEWVPKEWIYHILWVVNENPHHTFMFLTKNPYRYCDFSFPGNCWLGMTLTDGNPLGHVGFLRTLPNKTFISIEPLMGNFSDVPFDGIDLVIVGAMTGPGATPPKKEWIESIKHPNIFYKENIKRYM